MRALISYHFLVNVDDEAEAGKLAAQGARLNAEIMAREIEMLGLDPDETQDEIRSCGATVLMVE